MQGSRREEQEEEEEKEERDAGGEARRTAEAGEGGVRVLQVCQRQNEMFFTVDGEASGRGKKKRNHRTRGGGVWGAEERREKGRSLDWEEEERRGGRRMPKREGGKWTGERV